MVPRVNHLVRHGVFLMSAIAELVGAEEDAMVEGETARLLIRAHAAQYIVLVQIASQLVYFIRQEAYNGTVL